MLTVERAGGVYRDGWISVKTDRGSYCEQHNHPRYEKLRSLHRKAIQHTIFRLVEAWPTSQQRQLLAWWTLWRAQEQGMRRAGEPGHNRGRPEHRRRARTDSRLCGGRAFLSRRRRRQRARAPRQRVFDGALVPGTPRKAQHGAHTGRIGVSRPALRARRGRGSAARSPTEPQHEHGPGVAWFPRRARARRAPKSTERSVVWPILPFSRCETFAHSTVTRWGETRLRGASG